MAKNLKNKYPDVIEELVEETANTPVSVVDLTREDLNHLSPHLGKHIWSKEDLLTAIEKLGSLEVHSVSVRLEPKTLLRLENTAKLLRKPFPEFLNDTINQLLNGYGW